MDIKLNIKLQEKQLKALNCIENEDCYYVGYGGAKGGGKSYLVRAREIYRRLKYAGTVGVIIRRTFPQLRANHIRKFFMEYPFTKEWYRAEERSIHYPNGSITDFRHLDSIDDVYDYQGIEYDDIALDQAEQHEEEVFKILKTSLRQDPKIKQKYPNFKPKFLLTFNPGGIGHEWVKRIFIDRNFTPSEEPKHYRFIQAKVWDNPIFIESNPEYIKNLIDLPEDLRRGYLDGDFNIFYGQFFKKLREDKHLIDPFPIPRDWFKFRSLDWGYDHNAVCLWWAVSPDKKVYIYRGLKVNEMVVTRLASEILSLTPASEKVIDTFASNDLWARIKTDEAMVDTTMADLMIDRGLYVRKANQDRIVGWQVLMEYLEWNEQQPEPKLKIFKNYRWIFDDLRKLIHDDKRPEDVKKMRGDDTGDACRYGIMHLYEGKEYVQPVKTDIISEIIKKITMRTDENIIMGDDDY